MERGPQPGAPSILKGSIMGVQRKSGAVGILFGTAMAFTLLATSCGNDTNEEGAAAGDDRTVDVGA